ncbi:MAG: cbb3-type cytochrome c oxidase subunit 3 [Thioalkalivibrio sp.]|nr:MAG: cbb3-type cytochrome c oxidase subunit 3 [Thioalkalivibrio sp.]
MSFGFLHGLLTLLVMILFLGIVWWAFSSKQKKRFDEAANLPFADEDDKPDPERSRKGDE